MANTYLQRTESAGSRKKFTWSAWIKRSKIGASQFLVACSYSSSDEAYLYFNGSDSLCWDSTTSSHGDLVTNRKFRDTTGWYNIIFAVDTTKSSSSDRMKLYVNGVQETSFSTENYPSVDAEYYWNVGGTYYPRIGKRHGSGDYFDGYMSHIVHIDGTQELPTIFGSTDTTTGQWKINTSITPSVGWGTNGYHILKDGNSVTDQSGQGNNWTVSGGTLTATKDNPSEVFATLNPEECGMNSGATPTNGNTTFGTSAAQWHTEASTFGITRGKYYWETQMRDAGGDRRMRWGMVNEKYLGYTGNNKVLFGSDKYAIGWKTNGESATTHGYGVNSTETTLSGDINEDNGVYGFAIDYDNQLMWGSYNGTWLNSGNPSAGTGGVDVSSYYSIGDPLFPCWTTHNSYIDFNAGNGVFASTALTGTTYNDADVNGIFKYSVPTNFRCLSSKGINQ